MSWRFDADAAFYHGGPTHLEGGRLKRYGKSDQDMGALFFCPDTPLGRQYAAQYAWHHPGGGAVWRVRLALEPATVFDWRVADHRARLQAAVSAQEFAGMAEAIRADALDWTSIDDELFPEIGFHGVILAERPAFALVGRDGQDGFVRSVAVFDPDRVEIIDSLRPEDVAAADGSEPQEAGCTSTGRKASRSGIISARASAPPSETPCRNWLTWSRRAAKPDRPDFCPGYETRS
jgi:hypothetical protein